MLTALFIDDWSFYLRTATLHCLILEVNLRF
jgi:hypothetical protein